MATFGMSNPNQQLPTLPGLLQAPQAPKSPVMNYNNRGGGTAQALDWRTLSQNQWQAPTLDANGQFQSQADIDNYKNTAFGMGKGAPSNPAHQFWANAWGMDKGFQKKSDSNMWSLENITPLLMALGPMFAAASGLGAVGAAAGPGMGATPGAGVSIGPWAGGGAGGFEAAGGLTGLANTGSGASLANAGGEFASAGADLSLTPFTAEPFNVASGVGLNPSTANLGFAGPASAGGSVVGSGLGLSVPGISAGVGAPAAGGLGGTLKSVFGAGKSALSGLSKANASTLGLLGQAGADFYFGNKRQDAADKAAGLADPFASQRPQYQQQLSGHLSDPSSFMSGPVADQATEAAAKRMAAMGFNLSPAQADEMRKASMDQYYKQAELLSTLSGAGFGPGNAGQVSLLGNTGGMEQQYQGLGSLGTLLGEFLKNRSTANSPNYSLV